MRTGSCEERKRLSCWNRNPLKGMRRPVDDQGADNNYDFSKTLKPFVCLDLMISASSYKNPPSRPPPTSSSTLSLPSSSRPQSSSSSFFLSFFFSFFFNVWVKRKKKARPQSTIRATCVFLGCEGRHGVVHFPHEEELHKDGQHVPTANEDGAVHEPDVGHHLSRCNGSKNHADLINAT